MAPRYDPRVNLEYYTREAVRNADIWTDSAVRAEYSRLRDIAQKRLQRLAKSEPGSYAYRANVGQYAPARGQTTEEIRTQLPTLAKFIAAKTGSVSGIRAQRAKAVKTFREHGYNFITKENIGTFGDFKLFAKVYNPLAVHKQSSPGDIMVRHNECCIDYCFHYMSLFSGKVMHSAPKKGAVA